MGRLNSVYKTTEAQTVLPVVSEVVNMKSLKTTSTNCESCKTHLGLQNRVTPLQQSLSHRLVGINVYNLEPQNQCPDEPKDEFQVTTFNIYFVNKTRKHKVHTFRTNRYQLHAFRFDVLQACVDVLQLLKCDFCSSLDFWVNCLLSQTLSVINTKRKTPYGPLTNYGACTHHPSPFQCSQSQGLVVSGTNYTIW